MNNVYEVHAARRRYEVTREQIDACTRVLDLAKGGEVFYQVKSASDPEKVYEVRYHRGFGKLSCTCPAGLWNSTCWHRRAALIAEKLFKADMRAQYEAARREIESSEEYRMDVNRATAEHARASYLSALKAQAASGDEAAKREWRALRRHGSKAYDNEGFNLLK